MAEAAKGPVRCAIYTRKSTDEGLDQSFNSLDAQREACEAYASSQRHEGWEVLPDLYDDGGYSGGTIDRPALKQLLADVTAGHVDVIIIYKIDRLTRSLADFARIVDVLDRAGASFVSVTQSFNTTSSMGRLTLNVLLSFAQFEREVGAERVRDKIAASKRKGMWMGGVCPLGYDIGNRALVVNEGEAQVVRQIFDAYLQLGSVRALEARLREEGFLSKRRTSQNGVVTGGKPISRGALYAILRNVIYIGQVSHKGTSHPGLHPATVDQEVFVRTQRLLDSHVASKGGNRRESAKAMLTGRLWDQHSRPMSPTHTSKGSRHYRYYQSRRAADDTTKPVRISAGELEAMIVARLQAFLLDPRAVHDALHIGSTDAHHLQQAIERAASLGMGLDTHSEANLATLSECLCKVMLTETSVAVSIDLSELLLEGPEPRPLNFEIPARLIRRTKEVRLIVPPQRADRKLVDAGLIKLLVRARQARQAFEQCGAMRVSALAAKLGYEAEYFTVLLKLGYLSPALVEMVLQGDQPSTLTRQHLARIRELPISWLEQARSPSMTH